MQHPAEQPNYFKALNLPVAFDLYIKAILSLDTSMDLDEVTQYAFDHISPELNELVEWAINESNDIPVAAAFRKTLIESVSKDKNIYRQFLTDITNRG